MMFSSLVFLFAFLPAVLSAYYLSSLSGPRYRNAVLLVFSYVFYFWSSGPILLILAFSTLVDYGLGILIDRSAARKRLGWVSLSIVFNLSLLAYFKYANFFVGELNHARVMLGSTPLAWTDVVLPAGISFFTFHKITYVVDVYRGVRRATLNLVDFALYIALFPQLIAGPIVRYHEISEQIKTRTETLEGFSWGIQRFCWGLVKKVVFANSCGEIADAVFSSPIEQLDTKTAWLGVFAYTLQIYFDFSGYSDMAIGLGLLFGFKLPENFNRPYSAHSITDFWRRWHMTLSHFFRDYVYIPLGGNRRSAVRTSLNLLLVFVLCGLWHGANWTFLVWGAYHGGLLMLERVTGWGRGEAEDYRVGRRLVTLLLVMIGWVFFRAPNLGRAADLLTLMFVPTNQAVSFDLAAVLHGRNLAFLLMAAVVLVLPPNFSAARFLMKERAPLAAAIRLGVLMSVVLYSVALIASGSYNPFIYFRF